MFIWCKIINFYVFVMRSTVHVHVYAMGPPFSMLKLLLRNRYFMDVDILAMTTLGLFPISEVVCNYVHTIHLRMHWSSGTELFLTHRFSGACFCSEFCRKREVFESWWFALAFFNSMQTKAVELHWSVSGRSSSSAASPLCSRLF